MGGRGIFVTPRGNEGFFCSQKLVTVEPRIRESRFFFGSLNRFLIDLLAILKKSLDRALFLYIFIREVRSSGVRGSITIVHIRKFYKSLQNIIRLRFFFRIAKRSIKWLLLQIQACKVLKEVLVYNIHLAHINTVFNTRNQESL